jgi:hypothetical protein
MLVQQRERQPPPNPISAHTARREAATAFRSPTPPHAQACTSTSPRPYPSTGFRFPRNYVHCRALTPPDATMLSPLYRRKPRHNASSSAKAPGADAVHRPAAGRPHPLQLLLRGRRCGGLQLLCCCHQVCQ